MNKKTDMAEAPGMGNITAPCGGLRPMGKQTRRAERVPRELGTGNGRVALLRDRNVNRLQPLDIEVGELPRFGIEAKRDTPDGQGLCAIRCCIILFMDLPHCNRGSLVDFQLEDENAVGASGNEIAAADRVRRFNVVAEALRREQHT